MELPIKTITRFREVATAEAKINSVTVTTDENGDVIVSVNGIASEPLDIPIAQKFDIVGFYNQNNGVSNFNIPAESLGVLSVTRNGITLNATEYTVSGLVLSLTVPTSSSVGGQGGENIEIIYFK